MKKHLIPTLWKTKLPLWMCSDSTSARTNRNTHYTQPWISQTQIWTKNKCHPYSDPLMLLMKIIWTNQTKGNTTKYCMLGIWFIEKMFCAQSKEKKSPWQTSSCDSSTPLEVGHITSIMLPHVHQGLPWQLSPLTRSRLMSLRMYCPSLKKSAYCILSTWDSYNATKMKPKKYIYINIWSVNIYEKLTSCVNTFYDPLVNIKANAVSLS